MLKKRNLASTIICMLIILQPIITQITAIMVRNNLGSITVGMIFNGLIMIFGIFYTLFLSKSKYKKKSVIFLIILFTFCILFFAFKIDIFNLSYFIREAIFMFKYLFFPIIVVFLINLLDSNRLDIIKMENSIKISMLIYCLLIIIAEVSGTSFLSYQNSYSGKMGWFYSANEIGTLLVILLPYMFLNFNEHKMANLIFIILSIVTVLFIGTKTSFLGVILLLIVLFIYLFVKVDFKKKIILLLVICLSSVALFLISPPALRNIKQSFNYFLGFSKAENVEEVPHNARLSFLIFSERADFFEAEYSKYKSLNVSGKLFGMGFANNNPDTKYQNHLVEMDYFDILFKYGLVGFIVYILPIIYILCNLFKYFRKTKFKFEFYDIIYLYIIILTTMISFFAGHVLGSPSVSIFLAITLAIIFYRTSRRLS